MNTTLNNSNRRHQLSISVLNDIYTYNGKQGHKLDDWLADIENAATQHMFTDTQRRWSTPEQEVYGVYFAIKKLNYYLQGADIIVRNDHKPLAWFLNGKNENTKINRWGLELASIT